MKRRLILSVADQAIVSAFNFGLNLFLIRMAAPQEFGLFAIVTAASLFSTMVQNALVNTPLSVHLPIAPDDARRTRLLRVFTAANALLTLLVVTIGGLTLALWLGSGQSMTALSACLYLASQFVREYYRALMAVEGRLASLFRTDLACIVLAVSALAALFVLDEAQRPILPSVFLIVGLAGTISIVPACIASARLGSLRALIADMRQVFRDQWHEIRWSLLGVITTEIQNRGYVYIAAAVFGPAAVAQLQAGRILFGPLNLLSGAWARGARPQLAGLIGHADASGFDAMLGRAMRGFALFNLLFLAGLWMVWPLLSPLVFHGKYPDLEYLVAAWGIANIAFQCRSCLGIGVQAMRRFRELTMATIAGAAVSLVLTAAACYAGQAIWLIGPVIAGECVALLIVLRILRRQRAARPAFIG